MIDLDDQQAILKLIDERQDLLLEDLERLNRQILDIIEVYTVNRATDAQRPSQDAAAA